MIFVETISREIDFVVALIRLHIFSLLFSKCNYIFTPIVKIKTFEKYIEFFHATLTEKFLSSLFKIILELILSGYTETTHQRKQFLTPPAWELTLDPKFGEFGRFE